MFDRETPRSSSRRTPNQSQMDSGYVTSLMDLMNSLGYKVTTESIDEAITNIVNDITGKKSAYEQPKASPTKPKISTIPEYPHQIYKTPHNVVIRIVVPFANKSEFKVVVPSGTKNVRVIYNSTDKLSSVKEFITNTIPKSDFDFSVSLKDVSCDLNNIVVDYSNGVLSVIVPRIAPEEQKDLEFTCK